MSDFSNVVVLRVHCPVCQGRGVVEGRLTLGLFVCHLCEGRGLVVPRERTEWLRKVKAEQPSNPIQSEEPDAAS